jgi:hypothetical protein
MKKHLFIFLFISLFVSSAQFCPDSYEDEYPEVPGVDFAYNGLDQEVITAFNGLVVEHERDPLEGFDRWVQSLTPSPNCAVTPDLGSSDFSIAPSPIRALSRPSVLSQQFDAMDLIQQEQVSFDGDQQIDQNTYDVFYNHVITTINEIYPDDCDCEQQFDNCLSNITSLSDSYQLLQAQIYWNTFIKRDYPGLSVLAGIDQRFIRNLLTWLIQQDSVY